MLNIFRNAVFTEKAPAGCCELAKSLSNGILLLISNPVQIKAFQYKSNKMDYRLGVWGLAEPRGLRTCIFFQGGCNITTSRLSKRFCFDPEAQFSLEILILLQKWTPLTFYSIRYNIYCNYIFDCGPPGAHP